MFIFSNFLIAIAKIIDMVLSLYMWILIARAIISWFNVDPYNQIIRILYSLTDPLLNQIRRRLPISFSGIDFSPILVILAIIFLQTFLVQSLIQLASSIG